MKRLILLLCILFVCHNLLAIVKLPSIFSDNMVLQRNAPIKVWGSAGAGEKILVHFNKQIKQTIADSEGNWKLLLNKELAGGSYVLKVKGENNIVEYKNILVGDV